MESLYPGQRWQSAAARNASHTLPPLCSLSLAVMLGLAALPVESARADSCQRRTTVLSGSSADACVLGEREQLQTTPPGTLTVPGGAAVSVEQGASARQLLNKGQLIGDYGVQISNATLSGKLLNGITGQMIGTQSAVQVTHSTLGAFANVGEIFINSPSETDTSAVLIEDSTVTGNVNNTGTIVANSGSTALAINRVIIGGDLKNSGVIDGRYYGLALEDTTVRGTFNNSGTISAGAALLVWGSTFEKGFINSGEVQSTFVLSHSTVNGSFINSGIINGGDTAGISDTRITGDVINTGSFWGGSGAYIEADIQGSLVNTGSMWAGIYAFSIAGKIDGGVYNSGSISGGQDGGTGAVIAAQTPVVVNSGNISGSSHGLRISDTAVIGSLINSGTISGYSSSLDVSPDAGLGSVHITGSRARFDGWVNAAGVPFFIDQGATYSLLAGDEWTVKSLANQGVLALAAPTTSLGEHSTLDGDYTQAADAVLRTAVADEGRYGQLVVNGTATLPSQARIDVDVAAADQPLNISRLQDVLSATRLVSDGTFNVSSNSTLFDFGAVKDGNTLDLTLAARSLTGVQAAASAAGLGRAAAAAAVVDRQLAKGTASALAPYFATATSSAQVASALAATLPSGNQALRSSQAAMQSINRALNERLSATSLSVANPGELANPFWAQPFSYTASGAAASESATGTVLGMDTRTASGNRVGFAFAYADGSAANRDRAEGSQLDLWQFMAYGSHPLDDHTSARVYAGVGNNRVASQRELYVAGSGGQVNADYDSLIATLGTSLGQVFDLGERTRLMPSLRLDYNHVHEGAYRERGPASVQPLLLRVDARDSDQLIAGLDGTLEHALAPAIRLRLDLGLGYDLLNQNAATTAAYAAAPGERFSVRGESSSPWLLHGGLGVATQWRNGAELSVNYDVQGRSDFTERVAALKLSVPF